MRERTVIFLTGITGFVGRNLARHLGEAQMPVRALVRDNGKRSRFVDTRYAEAVRGDVLTPETLDTAMRGCDTVVHLVGIIRETKQMSFYQAHIAATANVLRAAKDNHARRFIHMSALGARSDAPAQYHRSKWQAEELVRASGLDWTIFEPSLIYGAKSEFLDSMLQLLRAPLTPIIAPGMNSGLLQPIHIDDMTACIVKAAQDHEGRTWNQTYRCGGPDRVSTEQIIDTLGRITKKQPRKIRIPLSAARLAIGLGEKLGLPVPATREQLLMLQEPNVCDIAPMQQAFDITPRGLEDGLRQAMQAPS